MRYQPLRKHLEQAAGPVLVMTYEEVEALLGRKLPNTAYGESWRQWWANTETHSQALSWLRAGWRVTRPDLANKRVEFRRQSSEPSRTVVPPFEVPPSAAAEVGRSIVLPTDRLSASALRMIEDAADESGGDLVSATIELLNRAAMARRRQLLDWFTENAPRQGTSAVTLIREDRDAR